MKSALLLVIGLALSITLYSQEEYYIDRNICEGDCIEVGVKKSRKLKYEWNTFGGNISSEESKIEVCPEKIKNLYYLKVFDKEGRLVEIHNFRIRIVKTDIEVTPEYLCVIDNKPITVKLTKQYDQVEWSDGSTLDSTRCLNLSPLKKTMYAVSRLDTSFLPVSDGW